MKKLITVSLFLVVAGLLFAAGEQEQVAAPEGNVVEEAALSYFDHMPDHIHKISQKEFVDKVVAGEDMTILDIRRADDYAKGHVSGAVNLPWPTAALYENLEKIPQSGQVFLYCYSGQTAGQAVMLLNIAGVPARSVNLGWNFGISKVDGADGIVETEANSLDGQTYDVDSKIAEAYQAYYTRMPAKPFASNIVSEEDAKKILDADDTDVQFVSIRQAKHYAEGHIQGAINVPWGKGMQDMFDDLPTDKKLIVYCYSGQTAGQTVAALKLLGYDVVSLKGGMGVGANAPLGWANKGYPVVN